LAAYGEYDKFVSMTKSFMKENGLVKKKIKRRKKKIPADE